MSRHVIEAEFEVQFQLSGMPDDEREVAYPKARLTYEYHPAVPAYTPPGEYAPIDPPEPALCELVSADLIDGDGLAPSQTQVNEWAEDWLSDAGYEIAVRAADHSRWR